MKRILGNNHGQGVVEYGLIIGLIIIIVIAAWLALKPRINGIMKPVPDKNAPAMPKK